MEKLYTIHLTDWLGEKDTYVTENSSGANIMKVKDVFLRYYKRFKNDPELLSKFNISYDVPNEPNPVPFFVSRYNLTWGKKGFLAVVPSILVNPVLTEQGVLRRAWEQGEQLEKARKNMPEYRNTPFGPMYY
ncbi:MAG: hypothetical protein MJ106_07050 [Lentisphaeria bacterium]|nr:hypothetical protein [Lentisphaeria bacterium]